MVEDAVHHLELGVEGVAGHAPAPVQEEHEVQVLVQRPAHCIPVAQWAWSALVDGCTFGEGVVEVVDGGEHPGSDRQEETEGRQSHHLTQPKLHFANRCSSLILLRLDAPNWKGESETDVGRLSGWRWTGSDGFAD